MADNRLKSLADRIERLMDERDGIQSDIRDIYAEAKSAGYVPKVLRKAITRKRMDPDKRSEEDTILDLYEDALSPSMRRAVQMAKAGAASREIETETGIDHVTVTRSVSLNKKSETPKPEDGDDGITGGEDERTEEGQDQGTGEGSRVLRQPDAGNDRANAEDLGGLRAGHDDAGEDGGGVRGIGAAQDQLKNAASQGSSCGPDTPLGDAVAGSSKPVPDGEVGAGAHSNESPATPSVGAVADDDLTIPPHLRGPSPANRRLGT